jgi:hypothetical protein
MGVALFVPCEEAMVVSSSYSEALIAPGLVAFIVPCGGSILMSSSGFGAVDGAVSVSPLLYPVLEGADELEETEESDDSGRRMGSSYLLPDFDFKMLEDSFF